MQLGAWVEFEQIVSKTKTAIGSQPATLSLGRVRRGIVIGMRQVYEVQAGSPPALTNPQTVLLVAVSLHRHYRVFPSDARPTSPSQPNSSRSATQPSLAIVPVAMPNPGSGATARAPIAQADLDLLVANEINRRIVAGDMYTAYDITLALRAEHPGLLIPHDAVRLAVRDQMEPIVASGLYDREAAQFGRTTASRYLPA